MKNWYNADALNNLLIIPAHSFEDFVNKDWQAGGQADATAKVGEEGLEVLGHALDVAPGVQLYQITESGLALQVTIQGTKYSKDDELS